MKVNKIYNTYHEYVPPPVAVGNNQVIALGSDIPEIQEIKTVAEIEGKNFTSSQYYRDDDEICY